MIIAKKLHPYFQEHSIIVLTNLPLRATPQTPNLSEWMIKWAMELSEYDIQYKLRLLLKGQVLANFIAQLP